MSADTDSVIMGVANSDLSKCLKPEYAHRWEEVSAFLFEDPEARQEQSGLFKVGLLG